MNVAPPFKKIALIGFGLIGGSIARAARAQGLAGEIVTTARSAKTRARVSELGIVDHVVGSNAEAASDADLVILCIPVGACGAVAEEIASSLKPGAIVSDVGSVKGAVVREMAPHLPEGVHFVPAHPVAGTEHSGPDFRIRRTVHQSLVHPHAAGRHRCERGGAVARILDIAGRQGRGHDAGPS